MPATIVGWMSLGLRIAALGDAHGTSSWSRFQMRLPSGRNAHHTPPGGLGSTPPLLSEPTRMSRWPRPSRSMSTGVSKMVSQRLMGHPGSRFPLASKA